MGTLLISKIREEYPDRMMMTFSVVPSPKVCPGQEQSGTLQCFYVYSMLISASASHRAIFVPNEGAGR